MTNGTERPCGSCHVAEGPHRSDCYWFNPSYESGRKTHDLKVNPQFWDALADGLKPFELRRNDRAFKVGDGLLLRRYDHAYGYTGQSVDREISYILYPEDCPGLQTGFVILGLKAEGKLAGYLTYDENGGDEEFFKTSLTDADFENGCTQKPVYFHDPS